MTVTKLISLNVRVLIEILGSYTDTATPSQKM